MCSKMKRRNLLKERGCVCAKKADVVPPVSVRSGHSHHVNWIKSSKDNKQTGDMQIDKSQH